MIFKVRGPQGKENIIGRYALLCWTMGQWKRAIIWKLLLHSLGNTSFLSALIWIDKMLIQS